jgi:hypothetical protein
MADEASAQPRGGEMVPGGDLRASHDDRDRVVEVLTGAAGDGRLTPEELDARVGAALTARTYGELAALVSDLLVVPDLPAALPPSRKSWCASTAIAAARAVTAGGWCRGAWRSR